MKQLRGGDGRGASLRGSLAALAMALMIALAGATAFAQGGPPAPDENRPPYVPPKSFEPRKTPFMIGADVSWIPEDEARGAVFKDDGVAMDPLKILKKHGFNYIRLRTFVEPSNPGGYSARGGSFCDTSHTLSMAKRIKALDMGFLLDFHYSDNWADPGKQVKPMAWQGKDMDQLVAALHDYTKDVMAQLKAQGTLPDMVQVGNEITPGMVWPDGRTSNWENLGRLLKAGISAVKEVAPETVIMLHIDKGGGRGADGWKRANQISEEWVDNALAQGVQFDVLGESCYTTYQGPPDGWRQNFAALAAKHPKLKFVNAEYSYDKREANDIMYLMPDERGLGAFIWEPIRYGAPFFRNTNAPPRGRGGRRGGGGGNAAAANAGTTASAANATAAGTGGTPPTGGGGVGRGRGNATPPVYETTDEIKLYDQMAIDYGLRKKE